MSCCPPGSWDAPLRVDVPDAKGTLMTLGNDLHVYYAAPSTKSDKALVVFPDVYATNPRNKCICDTLAEKGGYHVLFPNPHRGETKDDNPDPDFKTWLQKFDYDGVVNKDIQLVLDHLYNKLDVAKDQVGALGFCWGGWVIAKSSSEGVRWKVGVSCHPSTKLEAVAFGRDEKAMLAKTTMPFLLLPAGNDPDHLKPGSDVVKDLETRGGKSILFPNMKHGFSNRGDMSIEEVRKDSEKALSLALDFIKGHLG